jgi:murein DD-endopeptidase MepM/ murein hydrolase activator NlpD
MVKRGQLIGYVGHLSIKVPSNMLHLEMYSNVNDKGTLSGGGKYKRRTDLIDPSNYLNESEI